MANRMHSAESVSQSGSIHARVEAATEAVPALKIVPGQCPLCDGSYLVGQRVFELECGHVYHVQCWETWDHHWRQTNRDLSLIHI